jgi:Trp operon repressor
MNLRAVITADIVNSTKLSKGNQKKLMALLTSVLEGNKYEFYRGDSFQVFLKSPEEALLLALKIRIVAMKLPAETSAPRIDVKLSIGIGAITLPLKTLKTASGEAFILSGRAFDQMKTGRRLNIKCGEKNHVVNLGLKVLADFLDYLFHRLTYKQAAVVFELLMNRTQVEAAKRLKKSQATINKHTQSAGWPEIETLLAEYRQFIHSIEP